MGLLIYSYMPISSFKARVISSAQHYVEVINHARVVNQKINQAMKSKMMIQPSMWRNLICLWVHSVILETLQSGIFDFGAHIPSPYWHIKINTPREPPADALSSFFFFFFPSVLRNPKRDKNVLLFSVTLCTDTSAFRVVQVWSLYFCLGMKLFVIIRLKRGDSSLNCTKAKIVVPRDLLSLGHTPSSWKEILLLKLLQAVSGRKLFPFDLANCWAFSTIRGRISIKQREAEEPASTSRDEQHVASEKCQLLLLLPQLTLCEQLLWRAQFLFPKMLPK